jgi:hypothetical protein
MTWARAELSRATEPAGRSPSLPGPPALPPELRTCGVTTAGGGFGYHVIRNKGDVWQRVHWAKPPTDPQTIALPPEAYPIATATGICAWGEQRRGERQWTIHHVGSTTTVDAIADQEHAPAHCVDGEVEVRVEGGAIRIDASGAQRRVTAKANEGPTRHVLEGAVGKMTAPMSWGVLTLRRDDKALAELTFEPQTTLAGGPIPTGMRRDRVLGQGNGAGAYLFVERFVADDGTGLEQATLMRLDETGAVARMVVLDSDGSDRVISRLGTAHGAFFWIEAPATVVRISDQ